MLSIWDIRTLFLISSLVTITKSTKLLSGHKKCGDPECETFMNRVLAIEDYIGPDCRYLNFKTGEEIMVNSKLSRNREDLWAGSKGADFGYFPVHAVRIEETFITKEVELPTKETDFLCLDEGEYVFENEDSILNHYDKENEYMPPYSDERGTKFEMPEDEVLKLGGISYPNEYKEQFPDSHESDSKYKDLHTLETTSHRDTELRDRETRQDENTPEEDQISQVPQAVPTQSAWTVSGFAGWLGLGSNENEEAVRKISQKTEEITFRRRKIAITDDSSLKKLNEEGETAPLQGSSWFQSTFANLMHLGSDKSEFDLLYKENYPEIHDSSIVAGNAGLHSSSTASEGIKEQSSSEQSESSWFDLEFSDILPFHYAKENANTEKLAGGEEADQDEEQHPSEQSSLMEVGLRKQTGKLMSYEDGDKGKNVQETPKQTAEPTLYEEQVKEKYDQEAPDIHVRNDVQLADKHAGIKDAASPSPLLGDERLKSPYAEQDSIPNNQVMENNKIKAVTKESERTNDQSGWYESMYNSLIDYNRFTADNQPGHEYVTVESPQESAVDQLSYSHRVSQGTAKEEIHEGPKNQKSFYSVSYFTSILNFKSFISEGTNNAQHAHNNLKSSDKSAQFKKGEEVLHIGKEELLENQNITEKVPENRGDDTTQGNVLLPSLAVRCSEESRGKRQDEELVKDNTPHPLSVKSIELEHQVSYGQCTEEKSYGRTDNHILDTQGLSNTEDKNNVHNLEAKQLPSLELQNLADLAGQKDYTSEDTYSYEKSILAEDDPQIGKAVRPENVEQAQFFEELNEHPDSFSKSNNIPGEDKIPLDEGKPVIQGSREFNTKDQNPFLTEQHEAPEITYSVRSSPQQNKAIKNSKSSKYNVNKNNCLVSKVLGESSRTPVIVYTDVLKGVHNSHPVPHLHSEKHINNNNIRTDNDVDLHDEKKLPDVKDIESVPSHATQYYSHINPSAEDEMKQKVVTKVGKNLFSQCISELGEGKQGHNEQNTSSNQGLLSDELFQSEKEILGHSSCILNYDSVAYGVQKKGFQGPQVQIGEKGVEEEQNSKAKEEHYDSAQVSDASLLDQQEQSVFPYPSSSGTFSKKSDHSPQMCASLTHEKEDKEEVKGEQVSSSSLDCESTNIMSLVPDKKCINPKGHDRKQHLTAGLEVNKLRISAQHKKIDSIPNTEETKLEYQKQIAYTTSKITDIKPEDSLVTTDFNSLPQKQYTIVGTSRTSDNTVQHLEGQSETSGLDNNVNPSQHLSHHLQPVDDYMDPIPPHAKYGMDTQHLAKDHHDKTFARDLTSPFPKILNYAGRVAYSGHARGSQEKGKTDSEKKLECKNIDCTSDKTQKGGVSNIFDKISWFLEEPFKNKYDEDSKKYEDSRNIIGTQIKTKRQEAEVMRSNFEQDKGEVQSTKAISYLDNFKIKEERCQGPGERDSSIQEKSIAAESKNYNQMYDRSVNQETIVQNGQLTLVTELEATSFSGLQKLYFKFDEESKRILQANMCERHELQLLEQEFEKLHRGFTTFPCEDIRREMKELTTLVDHENKLNSGHEKCLEEKLNFLSELHSLALDIRNKCEIQKAESGMTNDGKLPGDACKEKHHLNLDKEPNSGQHTEANNVPAINTEQKIRTSAKNSQHQPNSKRKLSENYLVTHNHTINNGKEYD